MVLELFHLSQGDQDSDRHEAGLLGVENVARPDSIDIAIMVDPTSPESTVRRIASARSVLRSPA